MRVALPVFLVDNVATTGSTFAAARHALGFGTGLVFANPALSAKAAFKPAKGFQNSRYTLYSAEENMEIDKVVPGAASVKTKLGRGGTGEE